MTGIAGEGGGVLRWAVRESFVRYVRVIAAGTCEVTDGATVTEGIYGFPLRQAVRDSRGYTLSFSGAVRFRAHQGFLAVDIVDPVVRLSATGGALVVTTEDPPGDVAIMSIAAADPVDVDGTLVWSDLGTRLTAAGVDVFGTVYPEDADFAPLAMRVPSSAF